MSFDWSEYLELALDLQRRAPGSRSTEAMCRTAVSRAYYAAFLKSAEFLIAKGVQIPVSGEAHRAVPDALRQRGVSGGIIARSLLRLKAQRTEADYRQSKRLWEKEAEFACLTAIEILNDLRTCP